MLTFREALTRATGQLAVNPHLQPTALKDAAGLLMAALGVDRATLMAHPERLMDRDQMAVYQRLIEQRLGFEPMQYILGTQEFFGLELEVTADVLIPRPETELVVEAVLARISPDSHVLDVGTGSGAIALALAHSLPGIRVTAVDLSERALALAHRNAVRHGLEGRIRFLPSDLLSGCRVGEVFDAVVSNPPYVPEPDRAGLHPQVRDHEPAEALFAGEDGLAVYRRLIPQARQHLAAGGLLAMELGYGQAAPLARLLAEWDQVLFLNDLAGLERVVLAWRAGG